MADDKGDLHGNFAKETVALVWSLQNFPSHLCYNIVQKGNKNEENYQVERTVLIEGEIPISNNRRNVF